MNRLVIIILATLNLQVYAQETVVLEKPTVDRRIELLSIVFRLAERQEYTSTLFQLYTDRIEQHFEKHKNHELIRFTRSIMNQYGIGFDAVMSIAIHLDDDLNLLTDVKDIWQREPRWSKENAEKFVMLLQKFNNDAMFDDFFDSNVDLYTEIIERFTPVYELVNLNWYRTFFGKELPETLSVIIAPGNGGHSYGVSLYHTDGSRRVYAVVGVWRTGGEGMPVFDNSSFLTLLHELNHSFINYLTERNKDLFRESGEKIFSAVRNQMIRQAYSSWEIMLNEALVRAAVIKYAIDHNFRPAVIEELIGREKENGFFWIEKLVDELKNYDKQRDKYPTLESYMPRLAEAYKIWAEKARSIAAKRPGVVSISEFTNGSTNVSPEIQTITINFDMPLSGQGYSIHFGSKGRDAFPEIERIVYTNDNQSVVIHVNLEKNREYQFVLAGRNFTSVDGIGIEDYEVNFRTGE